MTGPSKLLAKTMIHLVAIGVFALLASGCSEEPVALQPTEPSGGLQFVDVPPAQPAPERFGYTEARIGPEGGTLKLEHIELVIPPGALAYRTKISLAAAGRGNVQVWAGPSYVRLSQPATLRIMDLRARTDYLRYPQVTIVQTSRHSRSWTRLPSLTSGEQIEATIASLGEFTLARGDTPDGGDLEPVRYLTGPGYATQLITAAEGGVVQFGMYRLTFPAGAVQQDTYITVSDPANGYAMCDLYPHGIEFAVPVVFEVDLSLVDLDQYQDLGIFWYDEAADDWIDQFATLEQPRIWVDLHHFSRYVVAGRAGW